MNLLDILALLVATYLLFILLGLLERQYSLRNLFILSDKGVEKDEMYSNLSISEQMRVINLRNRFFVNRYMELKVFFIIVSISVCYLTFDLNEYFLLLWIPFWLYVPDLLIKIKARSVTEQNNRNFPYFLEMLSMSVRNGMTIEMALKYVTSELYKVDENLANFTNELSTAVEAKGLVIGMRQFEKSCPTPAITTFSSLVLQSSRLGAPISEQLEELAKEIRNNYMFKLEEKIGKLSAKMSIPLILLIMFPLVILILAPGAIRILSHAF